MWLYPISLFWRIRIVSNNNNKKKGNFRMFSSTKKKKKKKKKKREREREAVEECTTDTGTKERQNPSKKCRFKGRQDPAALHTEYSKTISNQFSVSCFFFDGYLLAPASGLKNDSLLFQLFFSFNCSLWHWEHERNVLCGPVECNYNRRHDFTYFTFTLGKEYWKISRRLDLWPTWLLLADISFQKKLKKKKNQREKPRRNDSH